MKATAELIEREFIDALDCDIMRILRCDVVRKTDRIMEIRPEEFVGRVIASGDVALLMERLSHLEKIGVIAKIQQTKETTSYFVGRPESRIQKDQRLTCGDIRFLKHCGVAAF